MKNTCLSFITIIILSNFAFAEENAIIMQAIAEENSYEEVDKGLYLGLAYTHLSHDTDAIDRTTVSEMDYSAITIQVGYKFNPYIAVEGRYGMTLSDPWQVKGVEPLDGSNITVWEVYIKPIFPIGPEFDLYLLLGYANTEVVGEFVDTKSFSFDESSFSWGVGGVYDLTDSVSIFIDYTVFYDETPVNYDSVVDSFNFGVSYQF